MKRKLAPAKKRINKVVKAPPPSGVTKAVFYTALFVMMLLIIAAIWLYSSNTISLIDATVYSRSIALSFVFPLIAFSYLIAKGMDLRSAVRELGLSRDRFTGKALMIGILLFLLILGVEIALGIISALTGVQLPTNVDSVLAGAPLYFLLFGVFIAPINEEILFRGFLVKRLGIIISALIFAILHSSYGSLSEFAGVLAFGLIAGYLFKKTNSLYVTILGHILVNALTIGALIFSLG